MAFITEVTVSSKGSSSTMKQLTKHLILAVLYIAPVLLTYLAGTFLAVGDVVRAVPILIVAGVFIVAGYFRGLQLEEQNDYLQDFAPTPQWGKRLPKWARDTLPPTNPPPFRTLAEEPKTDPSGIRPRLSGVINWPNDGPPSVRADAGEEEDTITDTISDEAG